jgi:hypothetical protein
LKHALRKSAGKVLDLFREWDTNGDGEVSREEFHDAMPHLGFNAAKEDVDALFSSWDPDGSGAIDFKELQRILRSGGAAAVGAGSDARSGLQKAVNAVCAANAFGAMAGIASKAQTTESAPGPAADA